MSLTPLTFTSAPLSLTETPQPTAIAARINGPHHFMRCPVAARKRDGGIGTSPPSHPTLTALEGPLDLGLGPEHRLLGLRGARDHAREHVGNDVAVRDELDLLVGRRRPAVQVRILCHALD